MVLASIDACPAFPIIQEQDGKDKRLLALKLLTQPFPPSDSTIARITGLNRSTVGRLRKTLEDKGVEYASKDRRKENGRKTVFAKAWARIEELKKAFPRYGGRELWCYLVGEEGWQTEELPAVSSIDDRLSSQKMTVKPMTGKTDKRHYLQEPAENLLDRCGMDSVYPFTTNRGLKFQVVDIRDWVSGAVYAEPFLINLKDAYMTGLDQRAFAGVFLRFVTHIGIPKVLVLDNGAGQVSQGGWLPEIARWAINLGTIVEWEPYGRPWKSGVIERWHRDIQKWWADQRGAVSGIDEAFGMARKRALFVTKHWPRRQLGNKTAAQVMAIRDWPCTGEEAGPLRVDPLGKMGIQQVGYVRMQREVEQGGFVQLHGNDGLHVSDMLVGGYVRVEFEVRPGGEPGVGTVRDGKGEVVATFQHYMECNRPEFSPLVVNVKHYMYASEKDVRANYSQDVHNKEIERVMKRARAKGVYEQTGSTHEYQKSGR